MRLLILRIGLIILVVVFNISQAYAQQCRYDFKLRGGPRDQVWKKVTPIDWQKMLPKGWEDKGKHFYSRIRKRGPNIGINSPSDLESEIMKKMEDKPAATDGNRRAIVLPIISGQNKLMVLYDYDGKKNSKCQLVTLTF